MYLSVTELTSEDQTVPMPSSEASHSTSHVSPVTESGQSHTSEPGAATHSKKAFKTLDGLLNYTCFKKVIASSTDNTNDEKPHRIRVLSWNIQGLGEKDLIARTYGVTQDILREDLHVVFLQEVVSETEKVLREKLPMYHYIPANIGAFSYYYTAILVKIGFVDVKEIKLVEFMSQMKRNLLIVRCTVKGEKFCFMTSHLESTKPCAKTRKRQLARAFQWMNKFDKDHTVIFGGDLNLRDDEVGRLPENVFDIWEITGRRDDARYTWDLKYNDNIRKRPGPTPRFRFDRLYIKFSEFQIVKPVYFELIGFDRMKTCCYSFKSDHWGLLTHLDILSKVPERNH